MSDELDRLVRDIEAGASRLASGELDQEQAAAAAADLARLAGEAAVIVDGFARAPRPLPSVPGQERLPVDGTRQIDG